MTDVRPRRSVLYMPGSNARALEKARSLAADAIILDLEDSVAPDAKAMAREQVCASVAAGGFGPREVVIRVNAAGTEWHEADMAAAAEVCPDAILLPKVSSPADVFAAGSMLEGHAPGIELWAMIETPRAILDIAAIAGARRGEAGWRLSCFVMGLNDLAKETGARFVPGRAPMLPWMMLALTAARAEGLAVIDGVYNALTDAEGFAAECLAARDMGFDGKTLIHPGQIETANRVFAPDADEVAAARIIATAFDAPENQGKGAIALNGRMVERLHAVMAARTVALAEAIARREEQA